MSPGDDEKLRALLFVARTLDPKIAMIKLGQKAVTDAHPGPRESEREHI